MTLIDRPIDEGIHTGLDTPSVDAALDALEMAVGLVQAAGLDELSPAAELSVTRRLEVLRRRLDHGTDRAAGHLDASCAFSLDGHRNARCALKHLGRLSGAEAHGRTQTARALRELPAVEAAYGRGEIPTQHVRAIARVAANPRVGEFLPVADPIFAEQASTETYDDFCAWLRQWESLADADGAAQDAERSHERRSFSLLENAINGSWLSQGNHGALQGAAMKELLDRYEDAEFHADWAEARETHGTDARVEHLRRTPAQRRADALFEIFRRAGAAGDGRSPEPLVNIVIDRETFEEELRRAAGEQVDTDPNHTGGRRCQTLGGTQLHPPTWSPPPWSAMSVGSWSTGPAPSSIWVASAGCSPVRAATPPCCRASYGAWAVSCACGPAATAATATSTTGRRPPGADRPMWPTRIPTAPPTTASKNAASDQCATPTAPGPSTDPTTAVPSPHRPERPQPARPVRRVRKRRPPVREDRGSVAPGRPVDNWRPWGAGGCFVLGSQFVGVVARA